MLCVKSESSSYDKTSRAVFAYVRLCMPYAQSVHLVPIKQGHDVPQNNELLAVTVEAHCHQVLTIWRQVQADDTPQVACMFV